jgi:hypothetical protein
MSLEANTPKYFNQITGEANKVNWASIMQPILKIAKNSTNKKTAQ